jgi:hypothetical protein
MRLQKRGLEGGFCDRQRLGRLNQSHALTAPNVSAIRNQVRAAGPTRPPSRTVRVPAAARNTKARQLRMTRAGTALQLIEMSRMTSPYGTPAFAPCSESWSMSS